MKKIEHKDDIPDITALRQEREALLGRIAEIDVILNHEIKFIWNKLIWNKMKKGKEEKR